MIRPEVIDNFDVTTSLIQGVSDHPGRTYNEHGLTYLSILNEFQVIIIEGISKTIGELQIYGVFENRGSWLESRCSLSCKVGSCCTSSALSIWRKSVKIVRCKIFSRFQIAVRNVKLIFTRRPVTCLRFIYLFF